MIVKYFAPQPISNQIATFLNYPPFVDKFTVSIIHAIKVVGPTVMCDDVKYEVSTLKTRGVTDFASF